LYFLLFFSPCSGSSISTSFTLFYFPILHSVGLPMVNGGVCKSGDE
jgi:hypothetical protein